MMIDNSTSRLAVYNPRQVALERTAIRADAREPPLCKQYLSERHIVAYAADVATQLGIAATAGSLIDAALHWHTTRSTNGPLMLIDERSLERQPDVSAVFCCCIEPTKEALRAYAERFDVIPIAASAGYAHFASTRKPKARGKKAPLVDTTTQYQDLTPSQQATYGRLARRLDAGGDLYMQLYQNQPVTLELLDSQNSNEHLPLLTRWRIAVVASKSFFLRIKLRGFVRREFIIGRGHKMLVGASEYYALHSDTLAQALDGVLDVPRAPIRVDDDDDDDEPEPAAEPLPLPPHVLDRLARMPLDSIDIDEVERSAKHLMRTLFAVCSFCEAEDDNAVVPDLEIARTYPRGYLAVQLAAYSDAPGIRSRATHADYAALGLGVMCIAVRHEQRMQRWLYYAEMLRLQARSVNRLGIEEHIAGLQRFIAHTAEPDVERWPEMASLIDYLRTRIVDYVPENWNNE